MGRQRLEQEVVYYLLLHLSFDTQNIYNKLVSKSIMSNVWAANIVAAACAARISSCTDHHLQRALKATHLSVSLKMKSIQHTICKPNPPGINHRSIHLDGVEVVDHRMRWTAAFITAVCFHLGSAQASDIVNISSASEDQLLSIVRTIETRLDSTITSLRTILPSSAETAATAQQRQAAISLINEVYEVVDRNFDDSRNSAFSSKQWSSLHNDILQRPLRSMEETRSAVREMLSRLNDPYSRFLPPEEFSAMSKYDVSGVGVNLGTLDELQSKTGLSPLYLSPLYSTSSGSNNNTTNDTNDSPSSRNMEENKIRDSNSIDTNHQQRGVWVVGILRGSLAEQAGIKQGDQLVMADGAPLGNKSPFEVASLLQGSDFVDKLTGVPNSKPIQVVIRHVDGNQETIELNRPEKVRTPSPVTYKLEENGTVGYVKLSSFNARAQKDVSKAIKDLKSRGAERFVLDLRGNRGGLVSEGIEVARLFLSGKSIVFFVFFTT